MLQTPSIDLLLGVILNFHVHLVHQLWPTVIKVVRFLEIRLGGHLSIQLRQKKIQHIICSMFICLSNSFNGSLIEKQKAFFRELPETSIFG